MRVGWHNEKTEKRKKTMKTEYVVKTSCARMPSSCWGRYRRIAVLEVKVGALPKMISERARGVVRVVETWERLYVGSSPRCAYEIALAVAHEMCDVLNQRRV